jgi:hypothetical protein
LRYEGEELLLASRAIVDGLQSRCGEIAVRQAVLAVLISIVGKVLVETMEPLHLFLALPKSFDEVPFETESLAALAVAVG